MKKRSSFCWVFVLVISIFCSQGLAQGPEIGPDNGSLVIVGGAMKDPAIIERFLELPRGKDAPIIMIPTAGGRQEYVLLSIKYFLEHTNRFTVQLAIFFAAMPKCRTCQLGQNIFVDLNRARYEQSWWVLPIYHFINSSDYNLLIVKPVNIFG